MLIYGANGSGKSSICDAIEFGVRGVISRRTVGGAKSRREVRNLGGEEPPYVEVVLSTGRTVSRGFGPTNGARQKGAVPGFEHSPIVVRRSAVENFWQVSPEQRLDFFWDYMKSPSEEWRSPVDEQAMHDHDAASSALLASSQRIAEQLIPTGHRVPKSGHPFALPMTAGPKVRQVLESAARDANKVAGKPRELSDNDRLLIDDYVTCLERELAFRAAASAAAEKRERSYEEMASVFASAATAIAHDFSVIAGQAWIRRVRLQVADGAQLGVELVRDDEQAYEPEAILSEAYLDLLAILILIEVQVECAKRGQEKVLVLDDVFQSVDGPLRQRTLRHLCASLRGWQLVVTVHDRLWLELAERVFKEESWPRPRVFELRHGGFGCTPTVLSAATGVLRDVEFVRNAGGSAVLLAGTTGRALEAIYDHLR